MNINQAQLKQQTQQRYAIPQNSQWIPIINGDECLVWKVNTGEKSVIVRVSPAWRTPEEMQWVHDFTVHCSQTVPEVVQPLFAEDESTLFMLDSYPVTVFPFVEGDSLDLQNDNLRLEAARLLAQIHNASVTWTPQHPRPQSKASRPQAIPPEHYPDDLKDTVFDAWLASLPRLGLIKATIHGDYYRRNVLATDNTITGIIDWDEAENTYLMAEIGWCVWEFCQTSTRDQLDMQRARDFIDAYDETSTLDASHEIGHAVNFIRLRLRNQVAHAFASQARGAGWDKDYTETEMRAFVHLRDVTL